MSDNTYEVTRVRIESAGFDLLIMQLPENDIEDKLTYLAREKGLIRKSLYDDFIIATCVANINDFLSHLQNKGTDLQNLNIIRAEIVAKIIEVNKLLNPDMLIINKNGVVKFNRPNDTTVTKLIDNAVWNSDTYKETEEKIITAAKDKQSLDMSKIKSIKDLDYIPVQKFWQRLREYVTIKQFPEDSAETILGGRTFPSRASFEQYAVTICIEDIEDLFVRLDSLGLPSKVSPHKIIHELFELCSASNTFLNYDECAGCESCEGDQPDLFAPKHRSSAEPEEEKVGTSATKLFKNVPKEVLIGLGGLMKDKVIGQDKAIDDIVDAIQRSSVGLKDPNQPLGAFIFAGNSGTGKTHTAKILADALVGTRKGLITIDCSEYSADHEYSKLIGCFVPGTSVLMGDGNLKNIEEIEIGDKIITHIGNIKVVKDKYIYDCDDPVLKITTANSNVPIISTKGHEILAIKHSKCTKDESRNFRVCKPTCKQESCVNPPYEKYGLDFIAAEQLEIGDFVAYPRYKPSGKYPGRIDLAEYAKKLSKYKYDDNYVWAYGNIKVPRYIDVNKDLMRLAGYYVSEGGIGGSGKALNFTFNSKETDYINETVKLIRKIFGKAIRIKVQDRAKDHSYRVWASSKIVCAFMADLFGCNTYAKRLPEWTKDLPDAYIINFLETAIFGDGSIAIQRRVDYSTVSKQLFSQMQLLFRRLGYITSVQLERKTNKNHKDRYRIYIGGNQIEKFNEEFEGLDIDLSDIENSNIQRKAWVDDEYIYFQIKNLEKINYSGKVYDLSIEDDMSYVVGISGFSVHNSPAGYIGHEAGGYLTNSVKKQPFSVILFDEIEKANEKVHQLLLQVMDEARLTDGKGNPVSFRDTVIIMTSNVGVKEVGNISKRIGFGDACVVTDEKKEQAIGEALKKKFTPEFLNRVTSIVHFSSLTKHDYEAIIKLELEKVKSNLKLSGTDYSNIQLEFDNSLVDYIYGVGIDEKYGARPLKRAIEREIATPLARKLLNEDIQDVSLVKISIAEGELLMDVIKSDIDNPPFYMNAGMIDE